MRLVPRKTLYNHILHINTEDEIGREIIRKGIYDRTNIEILKLILKRFESPIVFDIGANIGNHAISISPECKEIHAFEPDASIMSAFKKNLLQTTYTILLQMKLACLIPPARVIFS